MWAEITRPQYERVGGRYASDAREGEWSHIAPLLPPAKPGGRPRTTNLQDVFYAILYMASTGCQWRMVQDFSEIISVSLKDTLKAPLSPFGAHSDIATRLISLRLMSDY
jgi:hypothetical protein